MISDNYISKCSVWPFPRMYTMDHRSHPISSTRKSRPNLRNFAAENMNRMCYCRKEKA
ncbi:hypothetical protein FOWG_17620 [Fusarium oxysporum f. sp. lycopersici MN25]|uniref:Uncharacterized protein n=1 Tax=Fusarium oxysporum f. sp. vasinfectum 25433 TaxID=1089449 RepID=X0KHE3_FUSOX|nr:hypothetical protein FOWG_17620 [Fusarium oxysporum f. sp. lycopersici MN25]EXM12898.1 hypothetical protein FOTG_18627 [Fusarium oxysporum f. sp. vasinfectum 25433]